MARSIERQVLFGNIVQAWRALRGEGIEPRPSETREVASRITARRLEVQDRVMRAYALAAHYKKHGGLIGACTYAADLETRIRDLESENSRLSAIARSARSHGL